jgi:hypothetical protein
MEGILNEFRDIGHDKGVIQLNLYAEFMKEEGIDISGAFLFHIDGLSSYYGDKGYKAYAVPMLPELTKELLKDQIGYTITDSIIDNDIINKL